MKYSFIVMWQSECNSGLEFY